MNITLNIPNPKWSFEEHLGLKNYCGVCFVINVNLSLCNSRFKP